jgi:hypothetical protein
MDHVTSRVNWTVTIVCSIALLIIGGAAGAFLVYRQAREIPGTSPTVPAAVPKPTPGVRVAKRAHLGWASAPAFSHVYTFRNGETKFILNETYGLVDVEATDPVRVNFGNCHSSPDFNSFRFDCEGAPSMITITDAGDAFGPRSTNTVKLELRYDN